MQSKLALCRGPNHALRKVNLNQELVFGAHRRRSTAIEPTGDVGARQAIPGTWNANPCSIAPRHSRRCYAGLLNDPMAIHSLNKTSEAVAERRA